MIAYSTLQEALFDWVNLITSLGDNGIIWRDQNGPRPNKRYIGLRIHGFNNIGIDYIGSPDDSGTGIITGNREFNLSIQHYGENSFDTLRLLKSSLGSNQVLDTLRADKIVFVDANNIINISELLDSDFEERAELTIRFRVADQYTESDMGVIESVEITGTTKNCEGTTITDETFLIET